MVMWLLIQAIATDIVAHYKWSVYVGHDHEPCKKAELTELLFGGQTHIGLMNHILHEGPDLPLGRCTLKGTCTRRPLDNGHIHSPAICNH